MAEKLLPFEFCRDEATRTPDPYVPNVVRYQLRYIPMLCNKRVQSYCKKIKSVQFYRKKFVDAQEKNYLCKQIEL